MKSMVGRPCVTQCRRRGAGVHSVRLDVDLNDVVDESPCTLAKRAATLFDDLRGSADSLILFGAGPLGRYALAGLRRVGAEPIAFADNNSQLWNKRVDGLDVLSPADAVGLYGERTAFTAFVV